MLVLRFPYAIISSRSRLSTNRIVLYTVGCQIWHSCSSVWRGGSYPPGEHQNRPGDEGGPNGRPAVIRCTSIGCKLIGQSSHLWRWYPLSAIRSVAAQQWNGQLGLGNGSKHGLPGTNDSVIRKNLVQNYQKFQKCQRRSTIYNSGKDLCQIWRCRF